MSNLNRPLYPEYSIDMISNVMSLRKPQERSLKILDAVLDEFDLSKNLDVEMACEYVHD